MLIKVHANNNTYQYKKVANKWGVDMAYGGLGDSSSMCHICGGGSSIFHADCCATCIAADQVCPSTTANHSLLLKNPLYCFYVNSHNCYMQYYSLYSRFRNIPFSRKVQNFNFISNNVFFNFYQQLKIIISYQTLDSHNYYSINIQCFTVLQSK